MLQRSWPWPGSATSPIIYPQARWSVDCIELPTWRIIAADDVLFVSVFGERTEGHQWPMYRITSTATGGALHQGFRRYLGEMARTARRVV